jgi:hypothetical protein
LFRLGWQEFSAQDLAAGEGAAISFAVRLTGDGAVYDACQIASFKENASDTSRISSLIFGTSTDPVTVAPIERMRITSGGDVGIGITPTVKLHIYESTGTGASTTTGSVIIQHGDSGGVSSIMFPSAGNAGSDYAYIQYQDSTTPGAAGETARLRIGIANDSTDHLILESSGNVGVNVATPSSYDLQVSGTIGATGDITAFTSDERLKTKTGTLTDALDKVCGLDTFTYTHNDLARSFGFTDNRHYVGISAQQVQKVLPEVVRHAPFDSDTVDGVEKSKSGQDYLTVQYDRIVPLLIEALKEERKAREALEESMRTTTRELRSLEERIKFLEQK